MTRTTTTRRMVPTVYLFARLVIGVLVSFACARLGQQPLIFVVERVSVGGGVDVGGAEIDCTAVEVDS